jgi:ribosome recycling factor
MPVKQVVGETKSRMDRAIQVLQEELRAVRTGRASTALVEHLKVQYYGTSTPLKQVASLAAPQADLIVIKPFDPASIRDIENAIKTSDLSIAPIVDGKLVRLNVPPLSEERRTQLVQQVKATGEQTKVSIRNIRRDANKHLEKEQKDKLITEDQLQSGKKQIDEITREYTDKVDSIIRAKSDDIMQQ